MSRKHFFFALLAVAILFQGCGKSDESTQSTSSSLSSDIKNNLLASGFSDGSASQVADGAKTSSDKATARLDLGFGALTRGLADGGGAASAGDNLVVLLPAAMSGALDAFDTNSGAATSPITATADKDKAIQVVVETVFEFTEGKFAEYESAGQLPTLLAETEKAAVGAMDEAGYPAASIASSVPFITQETVETLGSGTSMSDATLKAVTDDLGSAAVEGLGYAMTEANAAIYMASAVEGVSAGMISKAHEAGFKVSDLPDLAKAMAEGMTKGVGKNNFYKADATRMGNPLKAITKSIVANAKSGGLSESSSDYATIMGSIMSNVQSAATDALSDTGYKSADIAKYANAISEGSIAALSAYPLTAASPGAMQAFVTAAMKASTEGMTKAGLSEGDYATYMEKMTMGATAALANFGALSASQIGTLTEAVTKTSIAAIPSGIPTTYQAAIISSGTAGPTAGMAYLANLSDADRSKLTTNISSAGTAGLAEYAKVAGFTANIAQYSQYISSGISSNLKEAKIPDSLMSTALTGATQGAAANTGAMCAGLSTEDLRKTCYSDAAKFISQGGSAGMATGYSPDEQSKYTQAISAGANVGMSALVTAGYMDTAYLGACQGAISTGATSGAAYLAGTTFYADAQKYASTGATNAAAPYVAPTSVYVYTTSTGTAAPTYAAAAYGATTYTITYPTGYDTSYTVSTTTYSTTTPTTVTTPTTSSSSTATTPTTSSSSTTTTPTYSSSSTTTTPTYSSSSTTTSSSGTSTTPSAACQAWATGQGKTACVFTAATCDSTSPGYVTVTYNGETCYARQ